MATIPPIKYPLDLTGRNPNNLVIGEPHTIGATGNRAIVPNHGPFFTEGLKVRRASDGFVLTPRVHYKAAQLFSEATIKSGREVCSVIVIEDDSFGTEFLIDYQVLGGDYSVSVDAIRQLIETLNLDERPVRWGSILGKPQYFPPTPHLHDLGDLYGFEYLVAAIEGVRQAILLGDVYRDQEIYDYIDRQDNLLRALIANAQNDLTAHLNNLNNPHQVTKTQVGLGNVENYPVATDAQAKAGTSNVTYMTPMRTKAAIDLHALRMDNPHNTTKNQVGLGNVDNFATATLSEALAGVAQDKFVTPFLVQAMIDKAFEENVPPEEPERPPQARFTYEGATTVGHDQNHVLRFYDQHIPGTYPVDNWIWQVRLADNTVILSSNQQNPVFTFPNRGPESYSVFVEFTVNGITRSGSRNGTVVTQQITLSYNPPPAVPPTVDFNWTGSQTTVDPNNPVIDFNPQVTAGSAAIASYLWEFDVGSGAGGVTTPNPGPYTYNIPIGTVTKTVRLTVTDVNGLSGSKTKQITLTKAAANVPPTANFSYTGNTTVQAPANHQLTFTDQSTPGSSPIQTWVWDWGDGTSFNGKNPPPKQYNIAVGTRSFTVKLTITDANNLSHSKQQVITLTKNAEPLNPPTANFTTSGQTTVMEGNNHVISVTDTSTNGSGAITSWLWEWGDGTTSSGKTPPAHSYNVPVGTHNRTIKLTVTDSNGLSDTHEITIALTKTAITPPTAAFNMSGNTTVTEPSNHVINFSDASINGTGAINKWEWDFGDGTSHVGQTPPPKTYNVPVGTTNLTVRLKVTDTNNRTHTAQQTLTLVKNKFTLPYPTNLNFEAGDTGYIKNGTAVIMLSSPTARSGNRCGRFVNTGIGSLVLQGGVPCTPGQLCRVAAWFRPTGADDQVGGKTRLLFLDYWGNIIRSADYGRDIVVAYWKNVWALSAVEQYAPDGAYYYTIQVEAYNLHMGAYVEVDDLDLNYTGSIPGSGGGGNPGDGGGGGGRGGGRGGGGGEEPGIPQQQF